MPHAIDIVIPTYGRPGLAERTARAVREQCAKHDRVVIVWQGETAPRPSRADVILARSAPPNLPRARNRGVAAGKNPVVLFLDDDVEPGPGLLDEHRGAFSHDDIGLVAGFVDDPMADRARNVPSFYDERTGELRQNFSLPDSGPSISAFGANMSFRRTALEMIGGFDENYRGNALWEEIDCAFRLRAAGFRIWYCSSARVRHDRRSDGGCRNSRGSVYVYRQFANTAYFAARFAQPRYYRSWYRFWKYRLEYISRRRMLWLRHDARIVAAGVLGAVGGIAGYALKGHRLRPAGNKAAFSRPDQFRRPVAESQQGETRQ